MSILQIQKGENNPILRQKSTPIKSITGEILNLIKDMTETMLKLNGVGLAAPQVGKNIQLFVINPKLSKKYIFINPEINKMSKKTELMEEGCLSIPGVYKRIPRAKSLRIKAIDETGKEFELKAKDLSARVIQHELDHLNGILIIDKNE
jgi:peptide deformylase